MSHQLTRTPTLPTDPEQILFPVPRGSLFWPFERCNANILLVAEIGGCRALSRIKPLETTETGGTPGWGEGDQNSVMARVSAAAPTSCVSGHMAQQHATGKGKLLTVTLITVLRAEQGTDKATFQNSYCAHVGEDC